MPQQFDRALVAIGRQHAGAAEFEELQIAVARDQRADVEFAGGVEAAIFLRQRLAQQPIGADHRRPVDGLPVAGGMIEHQQMVADRVIGIDVAAREQPARIGDGGALLVENAIAQLLRLAHFGGGLRQPHLQRAEPAEAVARPMRARGPGLQSAIGLQRGNQAGDGGPSAGAGRKRSNRRTRRSRGCRGVPWVFGSFSGPNRRDMRETQAAESAIAMLIPRYSMGGTRIYDKVGKPRSGRKPGARSAPAPRAAARGRAA